jgi:predicted anti-sigma-YlaC factor YlaD
MDNCKQISRLVSEGMDRELTFTERLRVRFHLMMCAGCTNFAKQMQVLRRAARRFAGGQLPGEDN